MKSVFSKATVMFSLIAATVSFAQSDASVDFVKGVTELALNKGKPTDLATLESLWNSSIGYENSAKEAFLGATGYKEQSQKLFASLKELTGKNEKDLSKDEKKQIKEINTQIDAMVEDAKSAKSVKSDEVTKALGYLSLSLINNTLIGVGGKGVVENIKAGGMSPDVMSQAKSASAIVGASPDKVSGLKALAGSIIGIMQVHSIAIPSAEKATEGVTKG